MARRDVRLLAGDCTAELQKLGSNSIDSCVTDPPYHLTSVVKRFGAHGSAPVKAVGSVYARSARGFMGKRWDGGDVSFRPEAWGQVWRVLKPGAYLVAFGGTRTYHRIACAIEDAGFEVRDMISWLYGQGFPKSHDQGDGFGTALKPACEPCVLARKPLSEKTIEENIYRWGTGGLNIDGCRISSAEQNPSIDRRKGAVTHLSTKSARETEAAGRMASRQSPEAYRRPRPGDHLGRWPANVVHDGSEEVVERLPNREVNMPSAATPSARKKSGFGYAHAAVEPFGYGDAGSAARFFYTAKADKADRNGSKHPTVKPLDLMRWLVRLVTPPRGLVLDPFAGTGTTGQAAHLEGMSAVLIEREAEYVRDIKRRLKTLRA